MSRIYVGIDPGLGGAIAFILPKGEIEIYDTPTTQILVGKSKRNVHVLPEMWLLVGLHTEIKYEMMYVLEDVQPMPKFGSANFAFGSSVAFWEMALVGHEVPYMRLRPQIWKKEVGIPVRSDKGRSRLLAGQLYPRYRDLFARVKDDGRAEALLMAHCIRARQEGRIIPIPVKTSIRIRKHRKK